MFKNHGLKSQVSVVTIGQDKSQ